ARDELVDKLHGEPGARGDEADVAVAVELDEVEAVLELERHFRVERGTLFQDRGERVVAVERVLVNGDLGVADRPGSVRGDEQRIDLEQDGFEIEEGAREIGDGFADRLAHRRGQVARKRVRGFAERIRIRLRGGGQK